MGYQHYCMGKWVDVMPMIEDNDDDDNLPWDWWGDDGFDNDVEASNDVNNDEEDSMGVYEGQQFSTGNAVVAQAAQGTMFRKSANGTLEVVSVPQVSLKVGDRFTSKYGPATVVDLSSRFGSLQGFNPATQILYVADGSNRVRVMAK